MLKKISILILLAAIALPWAMKAQDSCDNYVIGLTDLPWSEDFEGVAEEGIPACWTQVTMATGSNPCVNRLSSYAHNSVALLSLWANNGNTNVIALPAFSDLYGLQMTFWARQTSVPTHFSVGVIDDNGAYVPMDTISNLPADYTEYTVNLTEYAQYGSRPAFKNIAGCVHIDDVTVSVLPSCMPPVELTVDGITTDGADLHFNYGDGESVWNLIVSTNALADPDQWTGTMETLYDTAYSLTQLTANTVYYLYLQSVCGNNDRSTWSSVQFRTACAALTNADLPYSEYFDSYGSGTDAWVPCWERIMAGAFPYLWANAAVSGNSLYLNAYYGANIAILPVLDEEVDMSTLMLRFWARQPNPIEVGVMTDPTDATTFQSVGTVTPAGYTFEELEVGLSSYQGTGRYVAIRLTSNNCMIDNLTLEFAPECTRPYAQAVAGVSGNSATLMWEDLGATNYTVAWGTANDVALATDSATTADTSLTITGLSATTTYYAWVRTNCQDGTSSNYGAFPSFTTPCTFATVPFHEDFDSLPGSGNISLPNCWTWVSGQGDNPCPYVDAGYAHSAPTAVSLYANSTSYPNVFALPPFDSLSSLSMSFWAYQWNNNSSGLFVVGVLEGSNFVGVDTISVTTDWAEYVVNFNTYTGAGTQPAFYGIKGGGDLRIHIDDIEVDYIPNCPKPTGVRMDNATTSTITFHWNQAGNGSSWEVAYDTVALDFSNPANTDNAYSTSHTLSGLQPNTTYYVSVRVDCGSEYSDWTTPVAMKTGLCDAPCTLTAQVGSNYPYGNYPLSYNTFTFVQSGNTLAEISGTDQPVSVSVCPNEPISLNWSTSYSYYASYVNITVADAFGEEMYSSAFGASCPNGLLTTLTTNCQQSSCAKPRNLTTGLIDSANAWLYWLDTTGVEWEVEYGLSGFTYGQGTTLTSYDDSVQITGLSPNTLYDVYVSSVCSDTTVTSAPITFRTGCGMTTTFPWSEGFEGYNDGDVPSCWEQVQTVNYYGTLYPIITTYGAHSGSNLLSLSHSTTGDINLIATPPFSDLTGRQMKFWAQAYYAQYYGASTFTVGAVTDSNTFVPTETISLTDNWTEYTVNLDSIALYGHRIGFRSVSTSTYQGVNIDDINIDLQPSCVPIASITVNAGAATLNSVTLSWTDTNNTSWEYILDTIPISNESLYTPITTTDNPLTISGLTQGTLYYIYLRPTCDAYTPWATTTAQTSLCNNMCNVEIATSGYGWGWADCAVEVQQNGLTMGTVTGGTEVVYICPNTPVQFNFSVANGYGYEQQYCDVTIYDAWGNPLFSQSDMSGTNPFYTYTTDCTAPACVTPRNLTLMGTTPNSATISWTDTMAANWLVAYSAQPFTPGTTTTGVTIDTAYTTTATLTGLQPQTTYHVYVRANCTDTTIWSSELSFTTGCGYVTQLPWTESFEGLTQPWQNNPLGLPQCWDIYMNYVNVNPCPFGGYAYNGQACVSVHSIGAGSGNHFALPAFADLTGLYFGYWGIMETANPATVFSIGVMSDSTGEYIPMDTIVMNDKYQYYQVDLTPYAQYGHRIAIYARRDTASGMMHIYMDDFIIDSARTCPNAGNLVSVSTTGTSATLDWQVMSSSLTPTGYQVEYGPAGFTLGSGTTVNVSQHPCTINGLNPSTNYDFYVRSNCGYGSYGAWSFFPGHFATECSYITVDYFHPVFESFENSSIVPLCWNAQHYGSNSPDWTTDYAVDSTHSIQFGRSTETYLVTPQLSANGDMTFSYYYKMREGYYTEQMAVGYSLTSSDPTDSTWVWLDTLSITNTTWAQRVDTIPFMAQWIAIHDFGTAYDNMFIDSVLITVGLPDGCVQPAYLQVDSVDFHTAAISWRGTGNDYEVELRTATTGWGAPTTVSGLNHLLTNLTDGTTYLVRVRQVCGVGDYSSWSDELAFVTPIDTTVVPCFAPTDLAVSAITYGEATLSWVSHSDEEQWMVRYWYGGVADSLVANDLTVTLTGLMPATNYYATVRALCGNVTSNWSDTLAFQTATCVPVSNVQVSNVTNNSATVSWTENGYATSWTISYGLVGHPFDEGTLVTVSENPYTITGLDAETQYDVMVRAVCGNTFSVNSPATAPFTTTVGIDEMDHTFGVALYPNPATDATTLSLSGIEGSVEVSVIDMSGRVVVSEHVECASADCVKRIDIHSLTTGAYLVRVSNDSINLLKRLIVK